MVARYNPCGAVVDIGRRTYRTRVRLYPDSDELFEIQWYEARPDAPFLPFPSALNGLEWEIDREEWLPTTVGEVYGEQVTFRDYPVRPLALGTHQCGTAEDFAGGGVYRPDLPPVEYRPDGLPVCCGPVAEGLGGGVGGGTAEYSYVGPYIPYGGAVGGGTAPYYYSAPIHGGGVGGGTAPYWYVAYYLPSGGGVGGGTAPYEYLPYTLAAGGGVGGGTAPYYYSPPPVGGGVGGGTAPYYYLPYTLPYGGGVGDGVAEYEYTPTEVGTGGGVGGGTAEYEYLPYVLAVGGGVGGGVAEYEYTPTEVGSGGAVGGGTAEYEYTPVEYGCESYDVSGDMWGGTVTRSGPYTWGLADEIGLILNIALMSWTLTQVSTGDTWECVPWNGEGTAVFLPNGAQAAATVTCAD